MSTMTVPKVKKKIYFIFEYYCNACTKIVLFMYIWTQIANDNYYISQVTIKVE